MWSWLELELTTRDGTYKIKDQGLKCREVGWQAIVLLPDGTDVTDCVQILPGEMGCLGVERFPNKGVKVRWLGWLDCAKAWGLQMAKHIGSSDYADMIGYGFVQYARQRVRGVKRKLGHFVTMC